MGYCIYQTDSQFEIKAENKAGALEAAKELMGHANERGGGGTSYINGQAERHFSWVSTDTCLNADSIDDILQEFGYDTYADDEGTIHDVYFAADKIGDEFQLFEAIAPFVEAGSFIAMRGEDGALWRWYFDGQRCLEEDGQVSYGDAEPPKAKAEEPKKEELTDRDRIAELGNENIVPEDF